MQIVVVVHVDMRCEVWILDLVKKRTLRPTLSSTNPRLKYRT